MIAGLRDWAAKLLAWMLAHPVIAIAIILIVVLVANLVRGKKA